MKKFKDILLSFILPRKMYKYHNLNIIYSVLILIGTALIVLFSVNLSTEKFTRQMIDSPDFEKNEYIVETPLNLPEYKIVQSNSGGYYFDVLVGTENTDTYQGVFTTTLKSDKKEMELTIVFDEGCDLFKKEEPDTNVSKELFDIEAYMMQYRNDERNDNDKEYLLFVFTKKTFYYLYNLGQKQDAYGDWTDARNRANSSYEQTSTGEYKYFLPKDESEVNEIDSYGNIDIRNWSVETTEGNTTTINGKTYKAEKRISSNIRKAIYNGEYVYGNCEVELFNKDKDAANFYKNKDIISAINNHVELMVASDASNLKSMYSFFAILINVVISFAWVFITWLLSRKFVMNKFKEYYAICAISYIPVSIIACILGFFISFETLMLFLLVAELVFYIVVTFRINTYDKLLDKEDDGEDENKNDSSKPSLPFLKPKSPKLDFKKVKSDDGYYVE